MPVRRSLLLLAMLAALLWAPSSVSAAQPDQLSSGNALPVIDETGAFLLSVHYTSTSGNPAQTVSAAVAGQTVPLVLLSGTALDGTWGAAADLPEGSWVVTFNATTAAGPQPPATYSAVTVGAAGSSPAPPQSNDPGQVDDPADSPTSSGNPAPQSSVTPKPGAAAPQRRPASPSSSPAPAAIPGGQRGAHERPRPRRSNDADPSSTPESEIAGGRGTPPPEPIQQPGSDGLWWILLWGSGAVGTVALVGTGWLLLAGRRERQAAESAGGGEADLSARAIPTVEQRALRRARLRQSDDPILAGLGLDEDSPRPKPRAATRAASPRPRRGARPQR